DQVAVLGRTAQLLLDPLDRDLERRALPERPGIDLVGQGRVPDVRRDRGAGAVPAVEDLGSHGRGGPVAVLDVRRPRTQRRSPPLVELGHTGTVPPGVTPVTGPTPAAADRPHGSAVDAARPGAERRPRATPATGDDL